MVANRIMPTVAITTMVSAKLRFLSSERSTTGSSWLSSQNTKAISDVAEMIAVVTISPLENQSAPPPRTESTELLEHIRALERDLDTIVWTVNPRNDTLDQLVGFICRVGSELLGRSGLRCRFDLPEEVPPVPVSPELRHGVFLVVREALTNIVKHAHAACVRLRLRVEDETLHCRIEDDGHGFAPEAPAHGERIIALWSLDCAYCESNLEALATLQRAHPKSIELITVTTDDITDQRPVIEARLRKMKMATYPARAYAEASPERINFLLDPNWGGETPRVLVIRADGSRTGISGALTPAQLQKIR